MTEADNSQAQTLLHSEQTFGSAFLYVHTASPMHPDFKRKKRTSLHTLHMHRNIEIAIFKESTYRSDLESRLFLHLKATYSNNPTQNLRWQGRKSPSNFSFLRKSSVSFCYFSHLCEDSLYFCDGFASSSDLFAVAVAVEEEGEEGYAG